MIKHMLNYILCPQLVVKTTETHLQINKAVTYLLNYLLYADFKWTRSTIRSWLCNQVQRQKAICDFREPGLKTGVKKDI